MSTDLPNEKTAVRFFGCFTNTRRRKVRRRYSKWQEARALIAAIDTSSRTGLRDRALIAAGVQHDKDGPLFRTTGRFTGVPHRMTQQDAYRMIQRRARQAGIKTRIGDHSMRDRHYRLS